MHRYRQLIRDFLVGRLASAEEDKLSSLRGQVSERLSAAQDQLSTIAGANVPTVGERGSRSRAAKKALDLEQKAPTEDAFGNSKKLREKASKLREKAFGKEPRCFLTHREE